MSTPYVGFSGDTLTECPTIAVGDRVLCPRCDGRHTVEGDDNGNDFVMFICCNGGTYLAGINGKSVLGQRPDCSGRI